MTDLERFRSMMDDFGVVLAPAQVDGVVTLTIEAKNGPRQVGYTGFVATWDFTADGAFLEVGIYE